MVTKLKTSVMLLTFLFSCPCHAATPAGQDVISNILWSGVVPDKGYVYFRWDDPPVAQSDVTCAPAKKDENGIGPHSECTASTGLPDVGPFHTASVRYSFKLDHLNKITIELDAQNSWQIPTDLPQRVTVVSGRIETQFVTDSKKPGHATLIMSNTDVGGQKKYAERGGPV